ncbi:F-box protein At1g78280-like [Limulus polyphemus]|uniref:F-box protein At1g78280-like n=1 Tax=Limulus polyphemus TaxID=6850 RepID=A0ABM1BQM3_LIMPO|nr:F-box protein At1g78280-like [Limulus polyphemus]
MANNNEYETDSEEEKVIKLREKLIVLRFKGLNEGLSLREMQNIILKSATKPNKCQNEVTAKNKKENVPRPIRVLNVCSSFAFLALLVAVIFQNRDIFKSQCAVLNNYIVMEVTRPVTDCNICKDVDSVVVLQNITREIFAKYAYMSRPVLVKDATVSWKALNTFNFSFFRKLYSEIGGAYKSVEEECQFFPFKTNFLHLQDVFNMPEDRAMMKTRDSKTWYIGWSNCNPDVAEVLRHHYSRPHFLPDDSESSAIDWIFMGYSGPGASMHLDYVYRPSWQAQIAGRKTWRLFPPPECESVCTSMNVTVVKGDIILIDTNQWYHDTYIEPGEMSITIGSEYD